MKRWASAKAEPAQCQSQRGAGLHQLVGQTPIHVLVKHADFYGLQWTKEFTLQASWSEILPLSSLCQILEFIIVWNCTGDKALMLWRSHSISTPKIKNQNLELDYHGEKSSLSKSQWYPDTFWMRERQR